MFDEVCAKEKILAHISLSLFACIRSDAEEGRGGGGSRPRVFTIITPNSDISIGGWVVGCNEFSEREELFVSYGKARVVFPPEENGNHPSISTVVKIYGCNLIFFLVYLPERRYFGK